MHLAVHTPMFGIAGVESHVLNCPHCGPSVQGADFIDAPIDDCYPGQRFTCKRCGNDVIVNWGLVEPDHLSTWISFERCPHRLCRQKAVAAGVIPTTTMSTQSQPSYFVYCEELAIAYNRHEAAMCRQRVWFYQRCFYCGLHLTGMNPSRHHPWSRTRDHIVPRAMGGRATVNCCFQCNQHKKAMTLEEFFGETVVMANLDQPLDSPEFDNSVNLQEIRERIRKHRASVVA